MPKKRRMTVSSATKHFKIFIVITLISFVTGCSKKSNGSDESTPNGSTLGKFTLDFIDKTQIKTSASKITTTNVDGLYFGELEIVAYNYRPGQSIQRWEPNNGFAGEDWSYWVLLQAGYDSSRNIVLKPDERLDISSLYVQLNPPVDQNFVKEVGQFSIDFLEVSVYRPGIIYDGSFYYNGVVSNPNPLYKYPEWSGISQYLSHPGIGGFAGMPGHGSADDTTQRISEFSILFARDDWFPSAVLVYLDTRTSIAGSSSALSEDQSNKIISLVSQTTQRRNIDHLLIVPYSLVTVALSENVLGTGPTASAAAQVAFDLSNLLESGSTFTGDTSVIKFNRDSNNVPFGTSLTFKLQ
ncbi:MAG TPA: hypothetical protein VJB59_01705 [Bdellovibrionota bacterium]|nr:hypothetical protein [Bdellovibrionota bacterium]